MDIRKVAGFTLTAIGLLLQGVWKLFVFFVDIAGSESEQENSNSREDPVTSVDGKYQFDPRNFRNQ